MELKKLRHLLLIEAMLAAAAYLAGSFLTVFFVVRDFSYVTISIFGVIEFGTATISLLVMRNTVIRSPRTWMTSGMALLAVTYGCYILLPPPLVLYVAPLFFGIYMPFFWLPFNTLYMDLTKVTDRGMVTGIYYLIWPVIGILMPVLGGASIEAMGYVAVFTSGMILVTANAVIISTSPAVDKKHISNRLIVGNIGKGLSAGFLLQGVQEGIFSITMVLLSFEFAKRELGFGGLLAVFAIAGALASVFIGKYTDMRGKRALFAKIGGFLAGPLLVVSALMHDILVYTIVMGAAYFALSLIWMLLLAISIDYAEEEKGPAVYTREVFLQGGRAIGAVVSFLTLLLVNLRTAHAISGVFIFLMIFLHLRKTA